MKTLTLNLKNNILVVECKCIQEAYEKNTDHYDIELICKASELTEEKLKGIINPQFCFSKIEQFISEIENKGCYWGENPLGDYSNVIKRHIVTGTWQQYQDKTFNLNKTLIFEIL